MVEGKIKNAIQRGGNRTNTLALLKGLVEYPQKDFSNNPTHPKHKTSDKKEIVRLKRQTKKFEARVATLKRQKAKLKTKAMQDRKQLAIKVWK